MYAPPATFASPAAVASPPLPSALAGLPSDDPVAILRTAFAHFGNRITLSCSFGGAGGLVLLDMAVRADPGVDVFVLDTDFLFPETYETIAAAERKYGLTVRRLRSALTPDAQAAAHGEALWSRAPDACCALRKVEPMRADFSSGRFDAWITAIRRDQSSTRTATEVVSWDAQFGLWKLCPLAHWDEARVLNYAFEHDVPMNPLLEQGYTSLGCTHCTRKPSAEGGRSGRWAGLGKVECGLHTPATVPVGVTVKGATHGG